MRRTLITLMFLVVAKKSRTLPSPIFSWWAGVPELRGSAARQLTQAGQWKYCIPLMSCSFYKVAWPRGRNPIFSLVFSMSLNPLLARSWNFSSHSVFFGNFGKSMKFMISGFHDLCSGTGCKLVTGWWEKLYTVCSAYSLLSLLL